MESKSKLVVLLFVTTECPIANKMAPEMERLRQKFADNKEVAVWLVYPNASDSDAGVEKHRKEYSLAAPFIRDPKHELTTKAGATVTPEAVVFDEKRNVAYRGRINDQFVELGKSRPKPTRHDLELAIDAVLKGAAPDPARTQAVGCFIEDRAEQKRK